MMRGIGRSGWLAGAAAGVLGAALAGCGGGGGSKAESGRTSGGGEAARAGGGSGGAQEPLSDAATNLQALYDTLGQRQASVDRSAGGGAGAGGQSGGRPVTPPARNVQGPGAGDVAVPEFEAPAPAPEPRRVETVIVDKPLSRAELAFRLAERIRVEPWSPLRQSVAMVGLELIEPGAGGPQLADLARRMPGEQAAAIEGLRRLMSDVRSSESAMANPEQLSQALSSAAGQLSPALQRTGMELGAVELCSRVESFGRFVPFQANRFLAGKAAAMIVYTEVKGFAQREERGSDGSARYAVELSQELELYFDADGSRQWRQAEQTVKDSARSARSDYYLVQRIDLPANLSVGRYVLKVIVRDRGSGGAVAERTIPLEIVADPKSTR
ncbi:MAG: hypothetical protein KF768_03875 [Phycisphaeraceae bacterium]|nr:hypothetical protein [Phycisphaeraceae bacterium]